MKKNKIFLWGMMGAGKSTISKHLSKKMNWPLLELDEEIEKNAGQSITSIFKQKGERAFRALETDLLSNFCQRSEPYIISLGGGTPLKLQNRYLMATNGISYYLKCEEKTLVDRLQKGTKHRPLLLSKPLDITVKYLLHKRTPIYKEADYWIKCDQQTPERLAQKIAKHYLSIVT